MVLSPTLLSLRAFALSMTTVILLSGCLSKPDPQRLPQSTDVATVFVVSFPDRPAVVGVPDAVVTAVTKELAERNIRPVVQAPPPAFERKRSTDDRLEIVASNASTPFVLLVEARVSYYSLISGRYRWDIDVKTTVAATDAPQDAESEQSDLAAFVDYDHQDHVEALEYAATPIARRVSRVVDGFLAARTTGPAAATSGSGADTGSATDSPPHPLAPGAVIYFAMVDRFFNGDPSNDGDADPNDPQGFHGGDFAGLTQKLGWLDELGVTTLWMSPVFEMREEKFHGHGAFHGYWVEDFGALEDRFGDERSLAELADAARSAGIGLMLDIVLNHVSFDAPLVKERPDWFHRRGTIEDWGDRDQVENYDVHGLPDLAQENPEVYEHLVKHSLRWQKAVDPVGFRLDAVKHVSGEFWRAYNRDVRQAAGEEFVLLGEDLDGNPANVARTMREGGFDAMFDFPLHFAMREVFCEDAHPGRLASTLFADRQYGQTAGARREGLVTLLDNHDLPRILSACGGDADRVIDAVVFMLTARGTPSFTWGTESGAQGLEEPANRADMQFESHPVGDAMRRWIELRRKHRVFTHGTDTLESLSADSFRYRRTDGRETVVIAFGDTTPPDGDWTLLGESERMRVFHRPTGTVPEADEMTAVTFAVRGAPPGEVHIAGGGPELGDWSARRAPAAGSVSLPTGGAFAFKAVVVDEAGAETWQPGPNHFLLVDDDTTEVVVAWRGDVGPSPSP